MVEPAESSYIYWGPTEAKPEPNRVHYATVENSGRDAILQKTVSASHSRLVDFSDKLITSGTRSAKKGANYLHLQSQHQVDCDSFKHDYRVASIWQEDQTNDNKCKSQIWWHCWHGQPQCMSFMYCGMRIFFWSFSKGSVPTNQWRDTQDEGPGKGWRSITLLTCHKAEQLLTWEAFRKAFREERNKSNEQLELNLSCTGS